MITKEAFRMLEELKFREASKKEREQLPPYLSVGKIYVHGSGRVVAVVEESRLLVLGSVGGGHIGSFNYEVREYERLKSTISSHLR